MGGYYCFGGVSADGPNSFLLMTTFAAGQLETYRGQRPAELVDLPIDYAAREAGIVYLSYDELRTSFAARGGYYWVVRVFREFSGVLDAYYQVGDDTLIHHFRLTMPDWVIDSEGTYYANDRDDGAYPAPFQWYQAIGRTYQRSYSELEYDNLDYYGRPLYAVDPDAVLRSASASVPIGPPNGIAVVYDVVPLRLTTNGDVAVYGRGGTVAIADVDEPVGSAMDTGETVDDVDDTIAEELGGLPEDS